MLKISPLALMGILFGLAMQTMFSPFASAQSSGQHGNVWFLVGAFSEEYEISVHLQKTAIIDGQVSLMAVPDCQLSLTAEAIDVTGQKPPIKKDLSLNAGGFDTFAVKFSDFATSDVGLVRIQISNFQSMGPCSLLLSERLYDASNRTQRIISNFMNRRADQISHTENSNFPLMVSGSSEEAFELSVHLPPTAIVDGGERPMAAADCQLSFTVEAIDASGQNEISLQQIITLNPGEFDTFKVPFLEFAETDAGHALIQFSNLSRRGPCQLMAAARITDLQGNTRAPMRKTGEKIPAHFIQEITAEGL